MDGYQHQQLSTFALTLYRYRTKVENADVLVGEMWSHSLVCLYCLLWSYFIFLNLKSPIHQKIEYSTVLL